MEDVKYYMHDTYVEIIRPIKATPILEYDSVGNVKDLTQTEDGSHPYLLTSFYPDSVAGAGVKNHPYCNHIALRTGQTVHVLYYDTLFSVYAEPIAIETHPDKTNPSKIAYVDWVAFDIDNNGVLPEKLFFAKEDLFAFMVKYIRAKEEIELEKAITNEAKDGDIFRVVGIERDEEDE